MRGGVVVGGRRAGGKKLATLRFAVAIGLVRVLGGRIGACGGGGTSYCGVVVFARIDNFVGLGELCAES
jgi:hypothetical protein